MSISASCLLSCRANKTGSNRRSFARGAPYDQELDAGIHQRRDQGIEISWFGALHRGFLRVLSSPEYLP